MDIKQKLVKLFSENTVAEVKNDGQRIKDVFRARDYKRLMEKTSFRDLYNLVERHKLELEALQRQYPDSTNQQLKECLYLLDDIKDEEGWESAELLHQLIKRTMHSSWTDAEKESYDRRSEIILNWKDFFFSYTNRDAFQTNGRFQSLLKEAFGGIPESRLHETNFVARFIIMALDDEHLKPFADWETIKQGNDIAKKIREYCRTSFTFLQLIERKSFRNPDENSKNWCLEEYEEFSRCQVVRDLCGRTIEDKNYFLITGERLDTLKPSSFPASRQQTKSQYEDWYEQISKIEYQKNMYNVSDSHLEKTGTNSISREKENVEKALKELAIQVREKKKEIIQLVLESVGT
ncbi:MAG: hypothetical protein GY801_51560 [bacterium]|nr:hypothetical protein [bacterium]